jgi:hypothetical protein
MYMVGHQTVSMDSNTIAPGILFPELEITPVVIWLDKTGFAVIAALNDMVGMPGKVHPCTPRHSNSFAINYLDIRLDNCIGDFYGLVNK